MQEITKPKLLIGEGKEEVYFFNALLKHLGIDDVQVENYEGKKKLVSYVKAIPVRPNFHVLQSVAVVRDADDNPERAFQSVSDALKIGGMNPPSGHSQFSVGCPKVGVFIMPDGQRTGMLEDLCMHSVEGDPATPCVEEYLTCILRVRQIQILPALKSKAWVHAWLASKEQPDKRLGEAAAAGYWPWDDKVFSKLTEFLRSL